MARRAGVAVDEPLDLRTDRVQITLEIAVTCVGLERGTAREVVTVDVGGSYFFLTYEVLLLRRHKLEEL
jgi:hypothetical protein